VRVWNQDGKVTAWSQPALWTMGLLQPADWQAKWIGWDEPPREIPATKGKVDKAVRIANEIAARRLPARWLRKEFTASRKVKRATVYFSGLGLSELYVNGKKVGDEVLSPGLTDYSKREFYVTHDVTKLIKSGRNAVGVILGNGRFYAPRIINPTITPNYGFPKICLQLEVEYTDGTRDEIVSDSSWKLTTAGPIQANNEYDGEAYDARREMPGWANAGFHDAAWLSAQLVSAPGGKLAAQMIEPIRVTGTLKPIAMTEPKPGVFIFDMGQNMVGWCRLRVRGPAGTTVSLRHAETLQADGTLYLANIRTAKVTDLYTLKGDGLEVYEPRFTYHGFRYVEVTGFPGQPTRASLEGRIVNDDLTTAGGFTCSQPMINRIYQNIVWGVRGNYRSIVTDCPQRDERQGWLGDRSAESKGEAYLFDIEALYGKWTQDMADSQKENGSISDVCPAYWALYKDDVTWPSSSVIIPGALLDQYGDTSVVARQYPSMVKWVDHMRTYLTNSIMAKDNYGDWCVPPEDLKLIHSQDPARKTAPEILATSCFYHCLKLMNRYATLLGKAEDAARFDALAGQLKTALNEKFYNPEKGCYDNGSQTACVLPLAFDLVPAAERERVFNHLAEKITLETKGHIGTGLIGGQWLNRVLTAGGWADLAYGFATNTAYPSWGYMAEHGATTIWELWNGNTADPAMNSGNHVMLVGDLVIWLYENLAGIQSDPAQPGFKHILMEPQLVGDLKFVSAWHRSPFGLIKSAWQRDNDSFDWQITIPANCTATLHLPASSLNRITEDGDNLKKVKGVKFLKLENDRVVLEVGSGSYRFVSRDISSSGH
jgi:alpha-L-rhamnosidase